MSDYKPPLLAPMNIADIIDTAVRLYRRNFGAFLSIIAIVYVPMGVFQVLLAYAMGQATQSIPENPSQLPTQSLITMGLAYGGLILISVLAVPIAQGALAVAVSRRYLGYPATVADAYGTIGLRWGALIATVLLVGIVVMAGMCLCLVPGIYLAIMWMFVTPIIAIEGLPAMEALKRSWDLASSEWWRCFSTYLLLSLLVGLITGAVSYPVSGLAVVLMGQKQMALAQALSTGVGTVAGMIVQPVLIIGLVLLYYDMRIRREGFDLYVLAQTMNVPAEQVPTYETYVKSPEVTTYALPPGYLAVPPELLDYARQARAAGLSYDEARTFLIGGGWPPATIDQHLPVAWAEPPPPPPPAVLPPPVAAPLEPPVEPPAPDPFAPDAPPPNHTTEPQ